MIKKLDKISCGPESCIFPLPITIVGVNVNAKPNYSTVTTCGVLSLTPPTIYISLNRSHPLCNHILQKGVFSVNTPSKSMFEKLDCCVADSNNILDESLFLGTFYGKNQSIPLIRECPINLECNVVNHFTIHDMEVIVGQVEKTYVGEQYLTEGNRNPHIDKIDPVIYSPDQTFWSLGNFIADSFSIGNCYKNGILGFLKHFVKSRVKHLVLTLYSSILSYKRNIINDTRQTDNKTEITPRSLIYPLPTVLLGSTYNKPNYSIVGNCGMISFSPPVVYVSSVKSHFTNIGIIKNKTFSINIPQPSLVKKTDYCGIVSGKNANKSDIFLTFYGQCDSAPLIKECPVNIGCRVIKMFHVGNMEIFVGVVIETLIDNNCFTHNKPDVKKINPILYALNRKYWTIGKQISIECCIIKD